LAKEEEFFLLFCLTVFEKRLDIAFCLIGVFYSKIEVVLQSRKRREQQFLFIPEPTLEKQKAESTATERAQP